MLIRPTYAKVDLSAIKQNVTSIKNVANSALFCAVVKADAYGHGAVMVSRAALSAGADWLAVALPEEARELRGDGITAPILVMGPSSKWQWEVASELNLSMVVASMDCIDSAIAVSKATGVSFKLHVKVDTGMNRVGFMSLPEMEAALDIIDNEPTLELEGLMTHFACADEADKSYTNMQNEKFKQFIDAVHKRGLNPIIHAANSAATIDCEGLSYDMVRIGISLYGCYQSYEVNQNVKLTPALSFHTQISYIKTIEPGDKLSYGGTFAAEKPMRVATLPIGYADGFNRLLSNNGHVLVRGKRVPIIGRVCMDQSLIDITDIKNAKLHDEVVCIGSQGGEQILASEFAKNIGTIDYEVLCAISKRVPRLYYEQ
ncbi:MAG: alanine racemase [Clostridia bacterium]|jgi:alanine racemase|nr:alanine racemase [Clostridia bacterium]